MVALGFNAAVSVRVSNELGANRPKAAKFSVIVAVLTSGSIGAVFFTVFLAWRTGLPRFFSEDEQVLREASRLGYLLAGSIFLNSVQPVLSGVAIGAGWQALVAVVNIGSYYFVGIPLAALFGFKLTLATSKWDWLRGCSLLGAGSSGSRPVGATPALAMSPTSHDCAVHHPRPAAPSPGRRQRQRAPGGQRHRRHQARPSLVVAWLDARYPWAQDGRSRGRGLSLATGDLPAAV